MCASVSCEHLQSLGWHAWTTLDHDNADHADPMASKMGSPANNDITKSSEPEVPASAKDVADQPPAEETKATPQANATGNVHLTTDSDMCEQEDSGIADKPGSDNPSVHSAATAEQASITAGTVQPPSSKTNTMKPMAASESLPPSAPASKPNTLMKPPPPRFAATHPGTTTTPTADASKSTGQNAPSQGTPSKALDNPITAAGQPARAARKASLFSVRRANAKISAMVMPSTKPPAQDLAQAGKLAGTQLDDPVAAPAKPSNQKRMSLGTSNSSTVQGKRQMSMAQFSSKSAAVNNTAVPAAAHEQAHTAQAGATETFVPECTTAQAAARQPLASIPENEQVHDSNDQMQTDSVSEPAAAKTAPELLPNRRKDLAAISDKLQEVRQMCGNA